MKHASLIALAGVALLGGCVKQEYSQQGRVNQDPLVIDDAMQQRDWDKSYAIYQNGSIRSSTATFGYVTRGDIPEGLNYVADIGTVGVNIVTMPYTIYENRHGVVSSGVNVPETYTAVPPVPPRYSESVVGMPSTPAPGGQDANVPINTINNPDPEHGNQINPTYPQNPARPGNPNNPNSAGNAAANDTSSGNGPGGAPTDKGSVLGSGGAGDSSGKGGKVPVGK